MKSKTRYISVKKKKKVPVEHFGDLRLDGHDAGFTERVGQRRLASHRRRRLRTDVAAADQQANHLSRVFKVEHRQPNLSANQKRSSWSKRDGCKTEKKFRFMFDIGLLKTHAKLSRCTRIEKQ